MRTSILFSSVVVAVLASLVPTAAFADDSNNNANGNTDPPEENGGYVKPHSTPYEGGSIPANATIEKKPNGTLIATGAGVLGAAYLGSLIYGLATCSAQSECRAGSGWLYMPIVGPFVTAAQAPTTGGAALALFDGGVQVLGAGLVIGGLIFPKRFVVWQSQSKTADIKLTPTAGGAMLTLTHM